MRQAGSVNRADSLFKMEPARKNKPARFPLTSYNRKEISTKITTDCRVGFKMMQNSVSIYKRASSPHVITSLIFYSVAKFHTCWNIELSIIEFNIQW